MPNPQVRVDDIGTTLKMKVLKTDGTDYPLTDYDVLQYKFQKPDGSTISRDADLEDDEVIYTTQAGDFDQVGLWKYQVYFEIGPVKHHTDRGSFRVYSNL